MNIFILKVSNLTFMFNFTVELKFKKITYTYVLKLENKKCTCLNCCRCVWFILTCDDDGNEFEEKVYQLTSIHDWSSILIGMLLISLKTSLNG